MSSIFSFRGFLSVASLSAIVSVPSLANESAGKENPAPTFEQCLVSLQTRAASAGVSESTVNNVIPELRYQEKVIGYDRSQPEFVQTFSDYFAKRVTSWRISKGQEMYARHKALLGELTRTYGVPASYLVAFWGLETNFGNNKGKMPILDSLATLACDQRRSEYFSQELINALLLLDREKLSREQMQGSWAGAMGHTQFMPSAYLKYALDGDGDGKIDLWNSEVDALTSAANFLQQLGWKSGYRWGREVLLPTDFDYQLAGKASTRLLSFWSDKGVTRIDGKGIGSGDMSAALLVPAGHTGPAFLVYDNFDVILKWNNSEYYALAVGHLADLLLGAAPLSVPLPELPVYSVAQMQALQEALNQAGHDVGKADGILGPATRKGVRAFQQSQGMVADGYPHQSVMDALINRP